jgi:hypothetical protein
MDIGSGLACRLGSMGLGRRAVSLGRPGWLAILAVAVMFGVAISGHLQPAPEPLLMAPLRWYLRA